MRLIEELCYLIFVTRRTSYSFFENIDTFYRVMDSS